MRWIHPLIVFLLAAPVLADVVILKDGRRIAGEVKKSTDGWTITAPDGKVTSVKADEVLRIELGGSADAGAADKLASLRRSVEPLSDIDQIIQRYQRFIAANPNTPAADEARNDLATWEQRKQQKLVKVGSRWMTPAERHELMGQVGGMAREAVKLAAGGQWRDANAIVGQILELDPANIAALYLQALSLYQEEKLVPARKAFEAINAQIANHAPTLNNLGVVSLRQNQVGPALNYFDQAMSAAPVDRIIVDNVAEALAGLKDSDARLPIAKKLSRRFEEQDAALAAQLAPQGLYRWGATWVNKQKYDELQAAEQKIRQRLEELDRERRDRELRIRSLDDQIVATQRAMDRMYADRLIVDNQGNVISTRLPAEYYNLQRDLDVMKLQRNQEIAAIEALGRTAARVKQELPVPKYTGVQRMIGPEGTPLEDHAPAEPPATQPG